MSIKIYNTLSRSLEEFRPEDSNNVKLYACGVTVYDEAHIGHASQAVFFDVIRSYLEYRGFKVFYVRNFTDIDDKIINKAFETGKSASEISSHYIEETRNDLQKIKVRSATAEPKVTDHVKDIIKFIEELIEKGFAYESRGDVLFSVDKFKGYGKLSNRKTEELLEQEPSESKKNPADFALWKAAKPGEPSWESPWGKGRPGWHIECSVMARELLGDTLDIHGGGVDLLFPHHENEIAQSESLTGKPFSRYWIHNGLVMVNNQKMSKSLGNFYTIKEALEKFEPDVIRYIILSHHYSSNIDFSEDAFKNAEKRVFYFYKSLLSVNRFLESASDIKRPELQSKGNGLKELFEQGMDDNFNTAKVIAELSNAFSEANRILSDKKTSEEEKVKIISLFKKDFEVISKVLNLLNDDPRDVVEKIKLKYLNRLNLKQEELQKTIDARNEFKKTKDYTSADGIRAELMSKGIKLLDYPNRTDWELLI
ncbi:cysteine--tRNA ligase [candidate division WOR-3 bacterium]|nr:cysteine--tRNA ligase [candidate division WOR-3 bacterium]